MRNFKILFKILLNFDYYMLLRSDINEAVKEAKHWFKLEKDKGIDSQIYKSAKNHLRGNNFTIFYDDAINKLNKIIFEYSSSNGIYAETDGKKIWINTYEEWDHNLLVSILIHEALHFIIKTNGKHNIRR